MARSSKFGVLVTGSATGALKALDTTAEGVEKLAKNTLKQGKRIRRSADDVVDGFSNMAARAAKWGAATVAASTAATAALVKSGLASGDALAKTADNLGIATEELAAFNHLATLSGTAGEKLQTGIAKMQKSLGDAERGLSTAVDNLGALGISIEDVIDLSPAEQFEQIGQAIGRVENPTQRMSIAMNIFGRGGRELINIVQTAGAGMDEIAKKTEIAGTALTRVDAKKIEEANDAIADVKLLITGLGQQLAVKFAPVLKVVADRMFGAAKEAGGMGNVATRAFNAMGKGIVKVLDFTKKLQLGWLSMRGTVQQFLADTIRGFTDFVNKAIKAYNALPFFDDIALNEDLEGFALSFEAAAEDAFDAFDRLAKEKDPGQKFEEFMVEVERASDEMAASVVDNMDNISGAVITTEDVTESFADSTEKSATKVKTVWEEALTGIAERIDGAFAEAWQGSLDSFSDFASNMRDGFKAMLGELAHLALTRPIIANIGAAFGLGAAGQATAQTVGGFGADSIGAAGGVLPWLAGGAQTILGTAYGGLTGAAHFLGFDSLASAAFETASTVSTNSLAANAGFALQNAIAGYAGQYVASELFGGRTTGFGATAGGFVGSAYGPWGTAAGAFLGEGIETLAGNIFGFGGESNNRVYADISGGLVGDDYVTDNGRHREQREAILGVTPVLQAFLTAIGGSSFDATISASAKHGFEVRDLGFATKDVEEFFEFMFREFVEGADHLNESVRDLVSTFEGGAEELARLTTALIAVDALAGVNTVTQAVEDFNAQIPTMSGAYIQQTNHLLDLVEAFDGSLESSEALSDALSVNKSAAYDLAIAIQVIGASIAGLADDQAQYFRDLLLTEQELQQRRIEERDRLYAELETLSDPAEVEATSKRLLELNREIFDNLTEEQQAASAEQFAEFAESVADISTTILDDALAKLELTQENLNELITETLREVADINLEAAQIQLEAARLNRDTSQSVDAGALAFGVAGNALEVTA